MPALSRIVLAHQSILVVDNEATANPEISQISLADFRLVHAHPAANHKQVPRKVLHSEGIYEDDV